MVYLMLLVGLAILLAGGKYLVDGATALASKLGISAGLIGLTVVAFGTSAPELLVSVNAALKGNSDIAMGNVIGSNISNISLVLGISAIIYPIHIIRSILKLDYLATLLSAILFYILALNGMISRIEGILLFVLLIALNWYFFSKLKKADSEISIVDEEVKQTPLWKSILLLLLGILGLYYGSDLLVDNAVKISQVFGVSERIIGVTVIAVGTSLPELVTSVIAGIKKETDIAIGNILGSNIMNILAIIGVTSIIKPIPVADAFLGQDFIWMLGLTLVLYPVLRTRLKISRREGLFLLVIYGAYLYFIL
ncbi:calcium/sodium antiporter [Cecembia rubra]|uniref:Cation:H+ antiporter n=1 Tax=Cecembia rubra TaxID=1485585 RepID=A0A2P8DXU0_9BACT|nr:calcium/sodium antiporter [Cecembia rubra]PSL02012.1 cation:H+ antiporter [Cecembia rubra]